MGVWIMRIIKIGGSNMQNLQLNLRVLNDEIYLNKKTTNKLADGVYEMNPAEIPVNNMKDLEEFVNPVSIIKIPSTPTQKTLKCLLFYDKTYSGNCDEMEMWEKHEYYVTKEKEYVICH